MDLNEPDMRYVFENKLDIYNNFNLNELLHLKFTNKFFNDVITDNIICKYLYKYVKNYTITNIVKLHSDIKTIWSNNLNNVYYDEKVNCLEYYLSNIYDYTFTPQQIITEFVENIPYDYFLEKFIEQKQNNNSYGIYNFIDELYNKKYIIDQIQLLRFEYNDNKEYIENYIYYLLCDFVYLTM